MTLITDSLSASRQDFLSYLSKLEAHYGEHQARYEGIISSILDSGIALIGVTTSASSLDISHAGAKADLVTIARILRREGFVPNCRPEEGDTAFATFWNHPSEAKIWLNFHSSQCRKVKVGTEIREVDVFEISCDDDPSPLSLGDEE